MLDSRQSACLRVGGITLRIDWPENIIPGKFDESYQDFIYRPPQSESPADITIQMTPSLPAYKEIDTLFTCGDSWCLINTDQGLLIRFGSKRTPDDHIWSALTDNNFRKVILCYCNPLSNFEDYVHNKIVRYPLDQILLINILNSFQGVIVHSAGGNIQGKGFIFPGISGAGKSTISRLLQASNSNKLFTDDRSIIRRVNNSWRAYGTPWPGDAKIARNEWVVPQALVFLSHAERIHIRQLPSSEALQRLLPTCSIPWYDRDKANPALDLCDQILQEIPSYELCFTPDEKTVSAVEKFARSL